MQFAAFVLPKTYFQARNIYLRIDLRGVLRQTRRKLQGTEISFRQFLKVEQKLSPNVLEFAAFVFRETFFYSEYLPTGGPLFTSVNITRDGNFILQLGGRSHCHLFIYLFLRRLRVWSMNVLFKSQWDDSSKETFTLTFSIFTKEYTSWKTQAKVSLNSIRKKISIHSDHAVSWASKRHVPTSLGKFYDSTWMLITLNQFTNARMELGLIRMVQRLMCFKQSWKHW